MSVLCDFLQDSYCSKYTYNRIMKNIYIEAGIYTFIRFSYTKLLSINYKFIFRTGICIGNRVARVFNVSAENPNYQDAYTIFRLTWTFSIRRKSHIHCRQNLRQRDHFPILQW